MAGSPVNRLGRPLDSSAPDKVDNNLVIGKEEFLKFREFFYRKTGIFFDESKRYFVDKRLLERVQITGSENFRDYFMLLRFQISGEELQTLINLMTVNETYFFREEYQFKCLVNSVLNEMIKHKSTSEMIRIWSVPCASGEEPYSLALYLLEYWPQVQRYDVELLASDIDTDIVNRARRGLFSKRSVHMLPPGLLRKYFSPADPSGHYQITEELRASVDFSIVNINNPVETRAYRNFDVIYCRNLLIYFDDVSRRQAVEMFYDALNPGGFVFLGHSESMSRISSLFKVRRFPDCIVYQKPL